MKAVEKRAWQDVLRDKAKIVKRTPDDVIELLEDTFQRGRMFDDDPHKMAYNIGQYELVEYIKQLRSANGDE